ncbi:MAG TPA: ABC transporter permease [Phycisphaerae bacterium]|nr:ABC transporter permease [Phycisphaerae bacterium]HOJ75321.1 ABC transporter permease [Phycisphaerae bacterium]HOM53014.1 ABC transporter permease [Phycisphaerae bacterium]HON66661.1 ABC transporter permease [Phycisphaerae bacterium]HOQ87377.1 ABC transporter permease [Phycisphaerae bacterium]
MSADIQVKASEVAVASPPREAASAGHGGGTLNAAAVIAQRELCSLFYLPIAYVVGFIFLLLTGYYFVSETLVPGNEASMRVLFERMAGVLVFALPLLTMRSIADEFSSGAIETLMTAPVSDVSVVVGKFFGALLFYGCLLVATLPHLFLLGRYAPTMVGSTVFTGYVGMILLGGLFLSIGIFASSCTRHQLLAAVIAMAILAVFTFVVDYGAEYGRQMWQREVCAYLNVFGHFADFSKGILDSKSIIFFVSGSVFFLFLATKVMESRRWR